jgi:predicted Zn-dependent protease
MILTEQQARQLIDKLLSYSKADDIQITITGSRGGNIRYARNTVTTTGQTENLQVSVSSVFGKRTGSASGNETDDASLKRLVEVSEEIARLAPENPEYMPMLGPQQYQPSKTYSDDLAGMNPEMRAKAAFDSISAAVKGKHVSAGYLEDETGFIAIGNSKGLFAYNKSTSGDFTITVRTSDDTGSGYARQSFNSLSGLNAALATEKAIKVAEASRGARELQPGKYTVIMDHIAVADLLPMILSAMDARSADEGRSFFGKRGSGNKIGEKLFDERINIITDPFNSLNPGTPFTREGLPVQKQVWIENGVLKNLSYSRYWAAQKGVEPIPSPSGMIMSGGNKSLEEIIAGTERGILVHHLWYIRAVSAQTLLYTGLTRDGVFYVEDGKIKYPVKNFRFNESPAYMLSNVLELGQTARVGNHILPIMKIANFNFTSISDAI